MLQREDADAIQKLFEERVRAIENASYYVDTNESACDRESRQQWSRLVPYQIVSAAMFLDNQAITSGNV